MPPSHRDKIMAEGEDLGEKANDNEEMLEPARAGLSFTLHTHISSVMMIAFW